VTGSVGGQIGQLVVQDLPPNLSAGWPVKLSYCYEENGGWRDYARLVGHDVNATAESVRGNSLLDGDLLLWGQRLQA
jgi:hypothetical protein